MVTTKKPPASRNTTGVRPERVARHDAQREVDRRADRAERDREQRGLAQAARDPCLGPPRAARSAGTASLQPARARWPRAPLAVRAGHAPRLHAAARASQSRPRRSARASRRAPRPAPARPPPRARVDGHHRHARRAAGAGAERRAWRRAGRRGATRTHRMAAHGRRLRSSQAAAPGRLRAGGVDDHPAGALGQHRLEGRPKSDVPVRRGGSDITTRAGPDLARLLHDPPPGLARADLLPVAGHAPPAAHPRGVDRAPAPAPPARASRASIGALAGTVIVTSTWMPRRRRAASCAAVATASRRVVAVLEGHQHRLVLHLVLHDRLGHHDLVVSVRDRPWRRR